MSEKIDLDKFKKYGEEGVLLLMSDSTNAQKNKNLVSETTVGIELEKHISSSKKRIIISTFASNIYRVQQIIKVAEKHKRKVAISGMSMDNMLGVSLELGYTKFNKSTLITLDEIQNCCDEDLVIITTGSQGEEMSALYRIAHGIHKQITISKNDLIILSSSAIPGNEKSINSMIDMLVKKGAEVIYNKNADVHSSGHACKDELSTIINLCKPKYFMPIHGEYSHLIAHKQIALETGIKDENIIIPSIGTPLLIEEDSYTLLEKVPSGKVFVNNLGAGYIGVETLRERESLAKKGLIVINILLNKNNKTWGDNIVIKNIGFLSDEYFNIRKASIEIMIDILVSRFKGYDEEKIETELKKGFSTFCYNEFKEIPNIYCKIYKL